MERSAWQQEHDEMIEQLSRKWGSIARTEWLKVRDRELVGVRAETRTRHQVIDKCRRSFESLSKTYHRYEGTTYEGWTTYGPKRDWDELVAASHDDAVWDRLVETFDTRRIDDA